MKRIFPKGIPAAIGPYCPAAKVGDVIYISGQIPVNPETGNIESDDIELQAHQVMKNLKNAIEGAGSSFTSTIKTTILLAVKILLILGYVLLCQGQRSVWLIFLGGKIPSQTLLCSQISP